MPNHSSLEQRVRDDARRRLAERVHSATEDLRNRFPPSSAGASAEVDLGRMPGARVLDDRRIQVDVFAAFRILRIALIETGAEAAGDKAIHDLLHVARQRGLLPED